MVQANVRDAELARPNEDRRHQARVALDLPVLRARRWAAGAWREIGASVIDISPRGIGLSLDRAVQLGDRLSLWIPLVDESPELRVTVEVRHVRADARTGGWRAGGLFKALAPEDYERLARFVMAELRSRQRL